MRRPSPPHPELNERAAALKLLPIVSELLDALETYISRLGNDRGASARIARSSHYGLFEPPVRLLRETWRSQEPLVHDEQVRALFRELPFQAQLGTLKRLHDSNKDEWDEIVFDMQNSARRLDAGLRRLAAAPSREPEETGFRVPGFDLEERIGEGGFGEVWRGRERSPLATLRAIKLLRPIVAERTAEERFRRESRALIDLNHRATVRYVSSGWTEDVTQTPFLVMELVSGERLTVLASNMEFRARVMAICEILDGVEYVHTCGVYHRDVKPSNILIRKDGQPVLVDFGLVSFADLDSDLTNASLGSPGYVPPEVSADPKASRGPNHDIFSAGVCLYEVLSGRRPNIQDYRPLTDYSEELDGLDLIVRKALASVAERFQSAAAFAMALRAWLEGERPNLEGPYLSQIKTRPFRELLIEADSALHHGLFRAGIGARAWLVAVPRA